MDVYSKEKLIKSLGNVRLVIGNGFDLYCGLATKYSDYFSFKNEQYGKIKNWFIQFGNSAYNFINDCGCWQDIDKFDSINAWDVFFCLIEEKYHYDDDYVNWDWCYIEEIIFNSLTKAKEGIDYLLWNDVFDCLCRGYLRNCTAMNTDEFIVLLASFVHMKNKEIKFSSKEAFYDFLLLQLKEFEIDFGKYIKKIQQNGMNRISSILTGNYELALNNMCSPDYIKEIHSFNYDKLGIDIYDKKLRNINGDYSNPIFGIDSSINEKKDISYIFSKTNRRMELDMISEYDSKEELFDNVIVFGHSLNEADYSYFFPLLDKMNMLDITKTNVIVFEFNAYKKTKSSEIKKALRKAINKLFMAYAKDRNYIGSPGRLLDSLTITGRVLTYEVPSIFEND